jgi:hypothetical protein
VKFEGEEKLYCTVCSEQINGVPLADFTVEWRGIGTESQQLCDSANCWDFLREQWTEWLAEHRQQSKGEK